MNKWARAILMDGLMFGLFYMHIQGAAWATNVVLFVSFIIGIVAMFSSTDAGRKILADSKRPPHFYIYDGATDIVWTLLLASQGWFVTATFFAIGSSLRHGVTAEVEGR